MKHGSLFSGIGGFDLAAEWMAWDNVFHCEWNTFGQQVLKYHFPNSISYNDITKTDFTIHRGQIDILTGGFPCQPYSLAGKRKGKEDERHLWPEMLRAIREIEPTWVVGENVLGLVNWSGGLVFEEVQADLEAEGYEVQPFILPAASVNAPHKRDRIWFIAYSNSKRIDDAENTNRCRCLHGEYKKGKPKIRGFWYTCSGDNQQICYKKRAITDTKIKSSERMQFKQRENSESQQGELGGNGCMVDSERIITNSHSRRQPCKKHGKKKPRWFTEKSFSDYWENFPTQSPLCTGDDGLSTRLDGITFSKWRNESIKAAGNAIVPQVALQIFKAIEEYEKIFHNSKNCTTFEA